MQKGLLIHPLADSDAVVPAAGRGRFPQVVTRRSGSTANGRAEVPRNVLCSLSCRMPHARAGSAAPLDESVELCRVADVEVDAARAWLPLSHGVREVGEGRPSSRRGFPKSLSVNWVPRICGAIEVGIVDGNGQVPAESRRVLARAPVGLGQCLDVGMD
jgi:hypothetical protein